jgi:hypothetical protein
MVLAACALLCACTFVRTSVGTPLRLDAPPAFEPGVTPMGDVLARLGAPDRIVRGANGDVFVYRYLRRNLDQLALSEPVITRFEFFRYSIVREREDRLVVLFGPDGRVQSYGFALGTRDLDGQRGGEGERLR